MHTITKLISFRIVTAAASTALAVGIALVAVFGTANLAPIVLAEINANAVVAAFALLIWAAIQDGKTANEYAA